MPRKNTRKSRRRRGWYHVYNRARDSRLMFMDDRDRQRFCEILERYLSEPSETRSGKRARFANFFMKVRVVTFALKSTHFHLVIFQLIPGGMEDLMGRVLNAYVKYFNLRHGIQGPMFDGEYRADLKLTRRAQLNAIAYVHDNHGTACDCNFCGSRFFAAESEDVPSWLDVDRGLKLFGGRDAYQRFRSARNDLRDVTDESWS
jgi:hypothetical protein